MEFYMKNKAGKVEKFHIDPQTGTAHKVNMRSEFMSRFQNNTKRKGRGNSCLAEYYRVKLQRISLHFPAKVAASGVILSC